MRKTYDEDETPSRPALTLEASVNENIALATNLAKKRLKNGTASAQEVCFYLKLGTTERSLELEKMRKENALLEAKTASIKEASNTSALAEAALRAFKGYRTSEPEETNEGNDNDSIL